MPMRVLTYISFALLSTLVCAQGLAIDKPLAEGNRGKESSSTPERVQTPRDYIESRLGGKIIKIERDPDVIQRAVLLVDRKGSVTRHVLEVGQDTATDLWDVRIVTPDGESMGVPQVIIMPSSLISPCWSQCKGKCGESTDCRVRCLFDCLVASRSATHPESKGVLAQ
ncbi:hypothetical protein [Desulfomonile tiedjei]|uniref:Uncharacterized protein n=1 Tax=Desulfomonile tiedjei (strain ATCC 49306 / DSM 6799 / DCB-1) TaxID=706587 RepID=I4C6J3_DESTA|nr:hypothetical protein [Desulfomonile tiedjei]AFM25184.1 hypothetical protein Desti_2504 [Desulfomonile tiedjei DSM 6799]